MILIPMIHVLGQGGVIGAATPFSATYETSWLLMEFLLVAVNCFVLITGYVSYGKKTRFYRLFTLWLEVILCGIGIFVVCSLIDWIRELLFRKLRIKDRLSRIEQKLCDKIRS